MNPDTGFITIFQHEAFGGAVWVLAEIALYTMTVEAALSNFLLLRLVQLTSMRHTIRYMVGMVLQFSIRINPETHI